MVAAQLIAPALREPQRLDGRRVGRREQQLALEPAALAGPGEAAGERAGRGDRRRRSRTRRSALFEAGELARPILGAAVHQEVHRQAGPGAIEAAAPPDVAGVIGTSVPSASLTGTCAGRQQAGAVQRERRRARPAATGRHRCGWRRRRCRRHGRAAAADTSRSPDSRRHGRGSGRGRNPARRGSPCRRRRPAGRTRAAPGTARDGDEVQPLGQLAHRRAAHRPLLRPVARRPGGEQEGDPAGIIAGAGLDAAHRAERAVGACPARGHERHSPSASRSRGALRRGGDVVAGRGPCRAGA